MIIDANKKLQAEIRRLENLYFVSVSLYAGEANARYRQTASVSGQPIVLKHGSWEREVAHNVGHFRQLVTKQLPRILRETVFVRLLSAFEVFITDLVREIYLSRPDLLRRKEHIEISYSYIVSLRSISELISRLVNRDCRALTSGGFREYEKYFQSKFQIRFSELPGYTQLQEINDRRHLLVHRLGLTDEQYRHAYNYNKKKAPIDESYLTAAFGTVRQFSDGLSEIATLIAAHVMSATSPSDGRIVTLALQLQNLSTNATLRTSPDFRFLYNEKFYILSDFIVSHAIQDGQVDLVLKGPVDVLRVYARKVNALARKNELTIASLEREEVVSISQELLEQVRAKLGQYPLSLDIHKNIAKELGIKERLAYLAIGQITKSGERPSSTVEDSPLVQKVPDEP